MMFTKQIPVPVFLVQGDWTSAFCRHFVFFPRSQSSSLSPRLSCPGVWMSGWRWPVAFGTRYLSSRNVKVVSQGLFKAEGRRPSGLSWMASSCPRNLEAPRLSRSATLLAFRHEQLLLDSCGFVFFMSLGPQVKNRSRRFLRRIICNWLEQTLLSRTGCKEFT